MAPARSALTSAARARGAGLVARTRAAVLTAAEELVARQGVRRTTMAQVAVEAGVAKATLYNHFRAKDDVLSALLVDRARSLAEACARTAAEHGLQAALEQAAAELAGSAALRRVAAEEPERLLPLLSGPEPAPALVAEVLRAAGAAGTPDQVDLAVRWLASGLLRPTSSAALVSAALDGAGGGRPGALPAGAVPPQARPAGLGWPA